MPTVSTPNLTLIEADDRVTIRVRYDATFSAHDRQLVGLGARYHSHVWAHDYDGGDEAGPRIVEFLPRATFTGSGADYPVTVGAGEQVFNVTEELNVPRDVLKVDAAGNDDEIKAVVRIHALDAQLEFTPDALSDTEVLND
jgi:hypothetical protein